MIAFKGSAELNAELRIMFKELLTTWPSASGPARLVLYDLPHAIGWRIRIPLLLEIEETITLLESGTGTRVTRRIVGTGLLARIARSWLSRQLEGYLHNGDNGLKISASRLPAARSGGFARKKKRKR